MASINSEDNYTLGSVVSIPVIQGMTLLDEYKSKVDASIEAYVFGPILVVNNTAVNDEEKFQTSRLRIMST